MTRDKVALASRMNALNESATLALNARAKQLAADGKTIYNLTAGELASDTPKYIQESVSTKLHANKYTPVAGLPELREKIAAHTREFYGLEWVKPANVVVTAGAKPALYTAFLALIEPGDEVIVPVPAWVSYMDLIKLAGGKVIEVPLTENYDLDVKAIQSAITPKTKAIILNSPHNPTGAVFSQKAVKDLASAIKPYNLYVISDDIYTKLVFEKEFKPVPTAGFDNLVIISGFSKSQALTGWRVGYMIADEAIAKAATSLLSHITGNAPLPSQHAAIAAMEKGDRPPQETLDTLNKHRKIVIQGLSKAGIKHNVPGGAFYVFLDLRNLTDNSGEWCEALLNENGVALVPGEAFSAPGFARLTYVTDESTLVEALKQIEKFMESSK